jgi:hypothetical protein
VTLDELTLDGLFAMNFLVASIFFSEEPFAIGDFINPSPFNWVVFGADKRNSTRRRGLAEARFQSLEVCISRCAWSSPAFVSRSTGAPSRLARSVARHCGLKWGPR